MENIPGLKGIIMDYGGTIDSRGDHWSEIIFDAYRQADVDIDKARFRDAFAVAERRLALSRQIEPNDNFFITLCKKIAIQLYWLATQAELTPGQRAYFDTLLPSDGQLLLSLADMIASQCYEHARQCIESARPALEALAAAYPMVLVSNFYGNIDTVLCDFRIRHLFAGIIESAVVGVRKPDPRIFSLGLTILDCRPDQALVVGDSLRKDIYPAESLGCHTAWIKGRAWSDEDNAATHPSQVADLHEIAAAIATR